MQLDADSFSLHCLRTFTGLKFYILTDPHSLGAQALLQAAYELYTDYVLKNPFYELEMPIRCELFDNALRKLMNNT